MLLNHPQGRSLRMERNIVIVIFFLLKGLEGNNSHCKNEALLSTEDKIVLSPLVIKAKIKSKFESLDFTEINIKVSKVFKGTTFEGLYLRFRYSKCPSNPLILGRSYIFYLSKEGQRPLARPELASRKVKSLVKKLACKGCGN